MASIKIKTGYKTYDIEDEFGNIIGKVSFNPKDINLIERLQDLQNELSIIMDKLTNLNSSDDIEAFLSVSNYDKEVKSLVDKAFADNVSSQVFGNNSVFNLIGDKTALEIFLDAIIPVITNDIQEAITEMENKVASYQNGIYEK